MGHTKNRVYSFGAVIDDWLVDEEMGCRAAIRNLFIRQECIDLWSRGVNRNRCDNSE